MTTLSAASVIKAPADQASPRTKAMVGWASSIRTLWISNAESTRPPKVSTSSRMARWSRPRAS